MAYPHTCIVIRSQAVAVLTLLPAKRQSPSESLYLPSQSAFGDKAFEKMILVCFLVSEPYQGLFLAELRDHTWQGLGD